MLQELFDEVFPDFTLRINLLDQLGIPDAHRSVGTSRYLPHFHRRLHQDVRRLDVVGQVVLPSTVRPDSASDPQDAQVAIGDARFQQEGR